MKINDILDSISIKINELFEDDYKIYTDNVKQGLEMPCFFIKMLPSNKKILIGNRYENECNLVIHSMLDEANTEKYNDISDKLYELEYITLLNGDILKGYGMRTEISDDVLLFFVTYKYFTYKNKAKDDDMENLTVDGDVKNE